MKLQKQVLAKYPHLKSFTKYCLFVSDEEYAYVNNCMKISINGVKISLEFLKNLIVNDDYYAYAIKLFQRKINSFYICNSQSGDVNKLLGYSNYEIFNGLNKLVNCGYVTLSNEQEQRYNHLIEQLNFSNFVEAQEGVIYPVVIDGKHYELQASSLIACLQMPYQEFLKFCKDKSITRIDGINKAYFVYAMNKYAEDYLVSNFALSPSIRDNLWLIKNGQAIDLEAINTITKTVDNTYKQVNVNPYLIEGILYGMPKDATKLEKAIYVYIKMCKFFTYDIEYMALNQSGPAAQKHQDIGYMQSLSLENNEAVCYEFNMLYAKILNMLGINFIINYKARNGEIYGDTHSSLTFRVNKFIVSADSVTSVLSGDLLKAKINEPLVGFYCHNKNADTREEFRKSVQKMYQVIISQENFRNYDLPKVKDFDIEDIMPEVNMEDLPLKTRFALMMDQLESVPLEKVDKLAYIIHLARSFFDRSELYTSISFTIVKDNVNVPDGKIATSCMVMALSPFNNWEPYAAEYYIYDVSSGLKPISYDDLKDAFALQKYEYISEEGPRIPNILDDYTR